MNTRNLLMASFLTLSMGAAMQIAQTASAGERPESIRAFVAEQQTQILAQGEAAREEIQRRVWEQYETARVAFVESQSRAIEAQGMRALASIKRDLRLIRLDGMLARTIPRPVRRANPPHIAAAKLTDR